MIVSPRTVGLWALINKFSPWRVAREKIAAIRTTISPR